MSIKVTSISKAVISHFKKAGTIKVWEMQFDTASISKADEKLVRDFGKKLGITIWKSPEGRMVFLRNKETEHIAEAIRIKAEHNQNEIAREFQAKCDAIVERRNQEDAMRKRGKRAKKAQPKAEKKPNYAKMTKAQLIAIIEAR